MILWPVQKPVVPTCSLCRLSDVSTPLGLPDVGDWDGEMVLTHVTPDQSFLDWVQQLPEGKRNQLTLQIHRHHWYERSAQLFQVQGLGVKTETVIDDWRPWDAIVLRHLWTSSRIVVLLNQSFKVWDFLSECPESALPRIFFAKPHDPRQTLATEKMLRLFLDIESAFPEINVRMVSLAQEDAEPASVEWELRRFRQNHRVSDFLMKVLHAIWPLRALLWVPFLLLCVMQNSMRGNVRQLRSFFYRVQGSSKAVLVVLYWAFRRLISCLKIWRLEVWTLRLWTTLGPWRLKVFAQRIWTRIALWRIVVWSQRFLTFIGLWRFVVYGQRAWSYLGLWRVTLLIQKSFAALKLWRIRMWAARFRTWLGLWRLRVLGQRVAILAERYWAALGLWRLSVYCLRLWTWIGLWRIRIYHQRFWSWVGMWRVIVYRQRILAALELWRLPVFVQRLRTWLGLWRLPVIWKRFLFHLELWRFRAVAIRIYWRMNLMRFWISDTRWYAYHLVTQIHFWRWPWFAFRYLIGRYLLKPYYVLRYQYQTRLKNRWAKAVNE